MDASALLAIVLMEPDAEHHACAISQTINPRMPAVPWFEATMRVDAMGDDFASRRLDDLIREPGITIIPFTADHAREACQARQRFGKPHPARLNFGDCMVYGVARHEREALLFKGADFAQTDIEPALRN